jgi:hypothetical protein
MSGFTNEVNEHMIRNSILAGEEIEEMYEPEEDILDLKTSSNIPVSPSPANNDVIGKRMIEYGEILAKGFEEMGEARMADARDFEKQCINNAALARKIAAEQAAEAVKFTDKMRRMSAILIEK